MVLTFFNCGCDFLLEWIFRKEQRSTDPCVTLERRGLTSDISEESRSRELSHNDLSIHTRARTLPEMKGSHWILEEALKTHVLMYSASH